MPSNSVTANTWLRGRTEPWTPTADNYVEVWHKGEDGVWYLVTDISNSRQLSRRSDSLRTAFQSSHPLRVMVGDAVKT
jgi:hypothetical protein